LKSEDTVVVIAADPSFRRSLAFLFEMEGFKVTQHDGVPDIAQAPGRSRCAVVDQGSLDARPDFWHRLRGMTDAIVVLLDRMSELPADLLVHAVEKPFVGAALVATVKEALLSNPCST